MGGAGAARHSKATLLLSSEVPLGSRRVELRVCTQTRHESPHYTAWMLLVNAAMMPDR